jgi:hypothetical protein
MKIIRSIVITFPLWYLPGFILSIYGETAGSFTSYFMFLMILGYYFLAPKVKPNFFLLILGITYYLISGLSYSGELDFFILKFVKFLVFIIGMSELVRRCKANYLFYFLLIGALSIIINVVFFPHMYGRYSGFYGNPNLAAFAALIGFCFCFKVSNKAIRMIGFAIFIFAGFFTFSRYFFLMWILLSLISVFIDKKNAEVFGIGVGSVLIIFAIASLLQLNTTRLAALENILGNQVEQGIGVLSEGSRDETWSLFYKDILNNVTFGNGFTSMSGKNDVIKGGVHNSFLLTIGEAGIIPFLLMIVIFGRIFYLGLKKIKEQLFAGLLSLSLCSYIFVSHNFYDNYLLLFFLLWLSWYLTKPTKDGANNELETQ